MNLLTFPWLLFSAIRCISGIRCIVQTKGNKLKAKNSNNIFLSPRYEFSCICLVSFSVNVLFWFWQRIRKVFLVLNAFSVKASYGLLRSVP